MSLVSDILDRRPAINKQFRFTLSYGGTDTVLDYAPDGFANGQTKIVRNKIYRGLFRTLAVNELTFIADGRSILETLYDTDGVDAECYLNVERFINNEYVFYASLKLDFATYKKDSVSVKIQAVDASILEKVKNRDTTVINLKSLVSLDGETIADFPVGLHFDDTNIDNNASWNRNASGATDTPAHVLPITIITSDFPEAKTPDNFPNDKAGACFYESSHSRKLKFSGTVAGNINPIQTGNGNPEYWLVLDVYDINGTKIAGYTLGYVYTTDNSGTLTVNIDFEQTVTINKGDSVVIQANWDVIGDDSTNYECIYQTITVDLNETYQGTPDKEVPAYGIFEAFYRAIQILTGSELFYSELFGRVDTPQPYQQDGYIMHLIKGRALRTIDNDFPITLRDLFLSVNSVLNIGMGYENGKFVVERINHFFNWTTTLDVSDRVTEDILEESAAPDLIYKNVTVGYGKFGKDKENSGYEYNTKSEFSTPIKSVTTSLNLISKYRADSTSIIRLMNDKDLSNNAEGDNDIFLIKSFRDTDNKLKARTGKDMDLVEGSVYAENSYNLEITPKRNLINWGNIITVGLPAGSVIRWQHTESDVDLCTRVLPTDDKVCERADQNYYDLEHPLYSANRYKFKIPLTIDEVNTIFDGQNILIDIGNGKSGVIDTLTIDNDTNEAEFTLIKMT